MQAPHSPLMSGVGRMVAGYDAQSGWVMIPQHVREMTARDQKKWFKDNHVVPVAKGAAYSMFEMMQPFQTTAGVAVTASGEAVLTQDTAMTLPANFFSFPGKVCWFHAAGIVSNVVTTPGTYTFRLRYNGVAGTVLALSGAVAPGTVVATSNLWTCDLYVKCLAQGQLTTSLTLLTYGGVDLANISDPAWTITTLSAHLAAKRMPAGGASLASVTALDGTVAKALTLTVNPSVATGSITVSDAWIVSMN